MIISVEPVVERTYRECATTQIEIRVDGWEGDTFCLWLPENVSADFGDHIWKNWGGEAIDQHFTPMGRDGFFWQYRDARSETYCDLVIKNSYLDITCSVVNKSPRAFPNAYLQNCLHFPKAPSFSSKNGETVYIRCDGEWIPVSMTRHWFSRKEHTLPNTTKFFFRGDTLHEGRYRFCLDNRNVDPERSDHPLIIKVSRDRKRTIGIAGGNWDFVFHNDNPILGCIHSQPLPVEIKPQKKATFKQRIYFCESNHESLIEQHANDALAIC